MGKDCYTVSYPSDVESEKRKWPIKTRAPQYWTVAAVSLGAFSVGNCMGYSSPALPDIKNCGEFPDITNTQLSWIGSLLMIGALCGSAIGGLLIGKIGRRNTLLAAGIPLTIGWLIISFAKQMSMLYVGRLVTGFAVGIICLAGPVYLSEISQPDIRGFLGTVFQVNGEIGILFSFVVGSITSWSVMAAICGFFPILFTTCVVFLPESPRYLLSSGKTITALESLCWLRGNDLSNPSKAVLGELDEVEESLQRNPAGHETSRMRLLGPHVLKPLLISLALMIFNQFCGIHAVGFYTVTIFQEARVGLDAHLSSIIVASVQVTAITLSTGFVEKVGRRPFLMLSFALIGISLTTLGIFFRVKDEGFCSNVNLSWVPLASVIIFNAAYSAGVGCLVWIVMSEILPTHMMGFGSGLATTLNWTLAFITTKFFHDLNDSFGIHYTFWLFASSCALACLFVFVFVPETKGKTLDQIQRESFEQAETPKSSIDKSFSVVERI